MRKEKAEKYEADSQSQAGRLAEADGHKQGKKADGQTTKSSS